MTRRRMLRDPRHYRRDIGDHSALAIAFRSEQPNHAGLVRMLVGALLLSLVLAALAVAAARAASPNIGIPLTPTTAAPAAGSATTVGGGALITPATTAATPTTTPGTPTTASVTPTTAGGTPTTAPTSTTPLNPGLRFSSGNVQFLPEYDSKDVLVIIDYQLAAGAKTPFTFQFRVPGNARMTGYALVDTNGSFDYDRPSPTVVQGDDWDVVTVSVPKNKPVHIEYYYDPGLDLNGERDFPIVFDPPAEFDTLTLQVQQPKRATAFTVSPGFAQTTQGNDGFTFSQESQTAVKPGLPVSAEVKYSKPDAEPSLPANGSVGGSTSGSPATGSSASSGSGGNGFLIWVLLALVAGAVGVVAYKWPRAAPAPARGPVRQGAPRPAAPSRPRASSQRRPSASVTNPATSRSGGRRPADDEDAAEVRFCTQCGTSFSDTDRFCSQCGEERIGE